MLNPLCQGLIYAVYLGADTQRYVNDEEKEMGYETKDRRTVLVWFPLVGINTNQKQLGTGKVLLA